jgi:hypothetical protein
LMNPSEELKALTYLLEKDIDIKDVNWIND